MDTVASNENTTSDNNALREIDASSKANTSNCRSANCTINSNNADILAPGSTILCNVMATETSHADTTSNASDYCRNKLE
jgi:hypothetical protein